MNHYLPDRWIIVEITKGAEAVQKVFAGWTGGYLDSDEWRMSAQLTRIVDTGDRYLCHTRSGSLYACPKARYGMTSLMHHVRHAFQAQDPALHIRDLSDQEFLERFTHPFQRLECEKCWEEREGVERVFIPEDNRYEAWCHACRKAYAHEIDHV